MLLAALLWDLSVLSSGISSSSNIAVLKSVIFCFSFLGLCFLHELVLSEILVFHSLGCSGGKTSREYNNGSLL